MYKHTNRYVVVGLAGILAMLCGAVWLASGTNAQAQSTASPAESGTSVGGWPENQQVKYPAEGEIISNDVRVRAGAGVNYYVCGLLARGDTVVVREKSYGWLKIDPPAGCYSLISAKYVKEGPGGEGVVTGTVVRVRAAPSHSTAVYAEQCKMDKGEKVKIVGKMTAEIDGKKETFYKIIPPAGKAYFWVAGNYVKYLGDYRPRFDMGGVDTAVAPLPLPQPSPDEPATPDRAELKSLDEALQIEMRRPIAERQLAELLAKYVALNSKTQSDSIRELTDSRIMEIKRQMGVQEALVNAGQIKEKFKSSKEKMDELYRTHNKTGNKNGKENTREMTGQLEPSHAFGTGNMERWRLVDPFGGKNLCYLMAGDVSIEELKAKEGQIVTVSGPTVYDPDLHLDLMVVNKIQGD